MELSPDVRWGGGGISCVLHQGLLFVCFFRCDLVICSFRAATYKAEPKIEWEFVQRTLIPCASIVAACNGNTPRIIATGVAFVEVARIDAPLVVIASGQSVSVMCYAQLERSYDWHIILRDLALDDDLEVYNAMLLDNGVIVLACKLVNGSKEQRFFKFNINSQEKPPRLSNFCILGSKIEHVDAFAAVSCVKDPVLIVSTSCFKLKLIGLYNKREISDRPIPDRILDIVYATGNIESSNIDNFPGGALVLLSALNENRMAQIFNLQYLKNEMEKSCIPMLKLQDVYQQLVFDIYGHGNKRCIYIRKVENDVLGGLKFEIDIADELGQTIVEKFKGFIGLDNEGSLPTLEAAVPILEDDNESISSLATADKENLYDGGNNIKVKQAITKQLDAFRESLKRKNELLRSKQALLSILLEETYVPSSLESKDFSVIQESYKQGLDDWTKSSSLSPLVGSPEISFATTRKSGLPSNLLLTTLHVNAKKAYLDSSLSSILVVYTARNHGVKNQEDLSLSLSSRSVLINSWCDTHTLKENEEIEAAVFGQWSQKSCKFDSTPNKNLIIDVLCHSCTMSVKNIGKISIPIGLCTGHTSFRSIDLQSVGASEMSELVDTYMKPPYNVSLKLRSGTRSIERFVDAMIEDFTKTIINSVWFSNKALKPKLKKHYGVDRIAILHCCAWSQQELDDAVEYVEKKCTNDVKISRHCIEERDAWDHFQRFCNAVEAELNAVKGKKNVNDKDVPETPSISNIYRLQKQTDLALAEAIAYLNIA